MTEVYVVFKRLEYDADCHETLVDVFSSQKGALQCVKEIEKDKNYTGFWRLKELKP